MTPEDKGVASLSADDPANIPISELIITVRQRFGKDTVARRVFEAFLKGRNLTHKDVWLEFGSSRASHHVYVLRRAGVPVITELAEVSTSDHGRKATIAVYRLPADVLNMARGVAV